MSWWRRLRARTVLRVVRTALDDVRDDRRKSHAELRVQLDRLDTLIEQARRAREEQRTR